MVAFNFRVSNLRSEKNRSQAEVPLFFKRVAALKCDLIIQIEDTQKKPPSSFILAVTISLNLLLSKKTDFQRESLLNGNRIDRQATISITLNVSVKEVQSINASWF
ncbi:hypothetical protein TNIN_463331 [Trichonephila inaurata madagascariensis]|uniref:Uncharacterized protein n=1 Tax=Trichonephila inaurata madagascariensis TaxID=2747483 RepID=A0A8X7BX71_9ARAC|nr:hypothetical protein TNIN_463331 [Trichonephila inaurata madagascariensis]